MALTGGGIKMDTKATSIFDYSKDQNVKGYTYIDKDSPKEDPAKMS
jgi:hypothetical protein